MSARLPVCTAAEDDRTGVADLLFAAAGGDQQAWAELVARYTAVVTAVVSGFRLQESDAADVVQNTWLRLLTYSATIREPEKLGGWLATTARREALGLIRRSRAEMASATAGDTVVDSAPSPEEAVMTAETRAAVRAAAGELTGRRRLLVDVLFYQPPQSYEEVSRRTGMPLGSIGPTRRRTLQELHQLLHARGPFSAPAKVA
jgi:RNA polymerase sigma factor (sigma-70 family)